MAAMEGILSLCFSSCLQNMEARGGDLFFTSCVLFQTKLNNGESCLSTALPYDLATLVKQFCRELPEPLFPSELHESLLKAQTLSNMEDRTSALQLLSCLLPARSSSCLQYLFGFLSKVSQRFDFQNIITPYQCDEEGDVFIET